MAFTSVSPCKPLPPIKETIPELLLAAAKKFHDQGRSVYLEDGISGEKRYFKDFEDETRRVASHFYKRGLRKGDVVIYMTSHQIHQVLLMMGVWRANGVIRSIYVDESEETILNKVEESNCKWIFCDEEKEASLLECVRKVAWPVEVIVCGPGSNSFNNFNEFYKDDGEACPPFTLKGNDIACIFPTSGTTGSSKGAIHSHSSAFYQIRNWSMFPFTYPKPNIIASKGTHISGALLPFCLLSIGTHGIVLPKVNKEILIRTVDKYKPGSTFAFPSFLLALGTDAEGFDVSSNEMILTGGSPVTNEMYKAYLAIPGVKSCIIAFGLTEGATVSTNCDFRDNRPHPTYLDAPDASVGKPYPGGEIQIRDLDTMEVLGPNQRGEVCTKGDFLFKGYYKSPESTEKAWIDGEWFRSGDLGYLDEKGYLYIVDRAKDIFKYYNNHISPTELESIISEHPEVKEACVFPIPDEGGECPRAFVTVKYANGNNLQKIANEIKAFADAKLASYKQLKGGLFIVSDFPKGKTGKVVRTMVAEMKLPKY